jgi:hypothetical protein
MRIRPIIAILIIIVFIGAAAAATQQTDEKTLLNTADTLTKTITRLRGLESLSPIKKGVKNREEITQFLIKQIRNTYPIARIQQEEKLLRKLGLLPEGVDYLQLIVNMLTEQIEGFYDPEQKTFFLASWMPVEGQEDVMIHELTHALQDQHFNIEKIMEEARKSENDDRALAQQAFWEGDATVTSLQYTLNAQKRHFAELPPLAFVMQAQMEAMQTQYTVLKTTPRFLRETLMFPYGYGASFLQQAWKQNPSWEAINKIYSDLPASTEQILHPEKYFGTRDNPKPVDTQAFTAQLGNNWKIAHKNVLGEFSLGLLLNLHLNEERSKRSVTGWGGDQVLLLENESLKNAVLIQTEWDSTNDAEKFFAAMDEWFRRHYPKDSRTNVRPAGPLFIDVNPTGFSLIHDGRFSSLYREGTAVRIIIELPESDARKLTGQITGSLQK